MIPASNPQAQYQAHKAQIEEAIGRVLASGRYILGPEVAAFEREFAAYCSTRECVSVANGTEALMLGLRALGVGAGDEVITVSHTAVATVAAIELAGATPVLADVAEGGYCIDPAAVEALVTPRTRCVIAVHLYGQPADMEALLAITRRHDLRLIEDCAQATGALWRGRRVGSLGDLGCFSFYPTKNLGALGDGGAVCCNNADLAAQLRALREYGWDERRASRVPGCNSRLDELQAAILRAKLPFLDEDNERRVRLAARYAELLAGLPLELPRAEGDTRHVYHLYVIACEQRDPLLSHLNGQGVGASIHYPRPVHLQPAYAGRLETGDMQRTERLAGRILSLPMYPELSAKDQDRVIAAIRSFPFATASAGA
jgi:dTDP-4-amino-4,6-dideoxygalactose transaminase